MTTDVAEQTQAVVETSSQAEAVTELPDEQLDAEIAAFSGGTQDASGTDGADAGTESKDDPELEAVKTAGIEEGKRLALEEARHQKAEEEARNELLAYEWTVKSFFDERAPAIRKRLTDEGLPVEAVNEVLNDFVALNGNSQQAALYTMSKQIERAMLDWLPETEREAFSKSQEDKRVARNWTAAGLLKDIEKVYTTHSRKGFVSEAEIKAAEVKGKRELYRLAEKDPEAFVAAIRSRKGVSNGNGVSAKDSRSDDELLLDSTTPMDTINKILARRGG